MKKITVNIPDETYDLLYEYCRPDYIGRYYFKDIINLAIIDYCRKNTADYCRKNTSDCSSNKNLNK